MEIMKISGKMVNSKIPRVGSVIKVICASSLVSCRKSSWKLRTVPVRICASWAL